MWSALLGAATLLALVTPTLARTWYITPDGTGDAPSIQAGIDSSSTGDVVELADGVYTGPDNTNLNFHGKAITLRSASDDPTVCTIDVEFLGSGLLLETSEPREAEIRGIALVRGNPCILLMGASPTIRNCHLLDGRTGLAYQDWIPAPVGAQPWVESCLIAGNVLAVSAASPWGRFVDCRIEDNLQGVLILVDNTRFEDCTFVRNGNTEDGAAIYIKFNGYQIAFESCEFVGNVARRNGGAIATGPGFEGRVTLTNCLFLGNLAARRGGAIYVPGYVPGAGTGDYEIQITSCVFTGNWAGESGGALDLGAGATVNATSSTFAFNRAEQLGGGILLDADRSNSTLTARTTVLWSNCALIGADLLLWGSDASFSCSVIDSTAHDSFAGVLSYGDDVVFADPMFCNPIACSETPTSEGDYSVRSESPCLAANNACGETIGYYGAGCSSSSVEPMSWSSIKAAYR